MTATIPPPAIVAGRIVRPGEITQDVATAHVRAVQAALTSLEQAIATLPASEAKAGLQFRALRLHNVLGRGGQALNDHFRTAQVSPDSAGGDKDGDAQPAAVDQA